MDEWKVRSDAVSLALGETLAGVDALSADPDDPTKRKGWRRLREYYAIAAPGVYADADIVNIKGKYTDWCGIFALWALKKAGATWLGVWRDGHGIGELAGMRGVADPLPGDVGYFTSNGHMDVIYTVKGNAVATIDGNCDNKLAGNFRGGLVTGPIPRKKNDFLGFVSAFPASRNSAVAGTWQVNIGSYTWIYTFLGDFTCRWSDLSGSSSGFGTWSTEVDNLRIKWANGSEESWNVPLNVNNEKGKLISERGSPVQPPTPISARRISGPK